MRIVYALASLVLAAVAVPSAAFEPPGVAETPNLMHYQDLNTSDVVTVAGQNSTKPPGGVVEHTGYVNLNDLGNSTTGPNSAGDHRPYIEVGW